MDFETTLYYSILVMVATAVYMMSTSMLQVQKKPRLRSVLDSKGSRLNQLSSSKLLKPLLPLTQPIANMAYLKKLQMQTEVLRINLDVTGLVLVKIFLSLFSGFIVYLLTQTEGYAFAGGTIGFFIPDMIFMNKIKQKKREIVRVFPETIDLIDLCIGAGLDFTSSLKWVIEKVDRNAFSEQLELVLKEIQVGRNRIDALKDMSRRLDIPDIRSFVRTVVQSERMGTSVEEAFRNLSEDTREGRFIEGERQAIAASLKILFPLLFFILPVIMIVVAGPIIIKFTSGELIPGGF